MKTHKRYSQEFKAEAVKMVLDQSLSAREVAKRLGMSQSNLAKWVVLAKEPTLDKVAGGPGSRTMLELEDELVKLRRELHETRQERDILK
ncbi:transposase [Glaciimonas sp. PAMC28666]|nr:transposase [Glaciimonas sp. PAMC28666]